MRNKQLTGYLLHHKPYQEKRALYFFFTKEYGVVHGIGKKGMPLFRNMSLFANGKRSLKTFTQIQTYHKEIDVTKISDSTHSKDENLSDQTQLIKKSIEGKNLYAGFYLNEILWKLLATEDSHSSIWQAYELALENLKQSLTAAELRILLRHFESVLFAELGCGISYEKDADGADIDINSHYRFVADAGFYRADIHSSHISYSGQVLFNLGKYKDSNISLTQEMLKQWSILHKQIIDHLLGYKELQSRKLWQQFQRYSR